MNEINDLIEKHKLEKKTMTEFMRYSLGKRAPKDEFKVDKTEDNTPSQKQISASASKSNFD